MNTSRRILFGVFDWGLGHATRDTPLIQALLEAGDRVEILTTGRALKVLRKRFGDDCACHDVPSIASPHTRTRHFAASFILSVPKMYLSLRKARDESREIVRRGRYDLVISDCRFDLHDHIENSVLINHQLRFNSPRPMEVVGEAWLAASMARYGRIVVPDVPGPHNLSGRLSHDIRHVDPSRVHYIGILSHLRRVNADRDIDCFISLTGSEPQRSILERKILTQVRELPGRTVMAGGNPDARRKERAGDLEFHSYLTTPQQEEMMNRARRFVSRAGYTSIMEAAELGLNNVLLIPTPGIPEQEYLGDYCEREGRFHHVHQDRLALKTDAAHSGKLNGFTPPWYTEESVRRFLEVLGDKTRVGDRRPADQERFSQRPPLSLAAPPP